MGRPGTIAAVAQLFGCTEEQAAKEVRLVEQANGHIVHTEELLLLGFPAVEQDLYSASWNPLGLGGKEPDTWFVWLCNGSVRQAIAAMPYALDYVAFARDNGPRRIYKLSSLLAKII